MSLVISAWNKSVGIALCEGRVGAWIDGKYVPTSRACSAASIAFRFSASWM